VTVNVKEMENGRPIRFWNRTDSWCRFSWIICDKNCIKSDSFYGYVDINKSWQDNISVEEQWAKILNDRKRQIVAHREEQSIKITEILQHR
jgi:hypothetical protein